jgi:glycosyltransferase involved in cell wall biosynthesis
MQEQNCRNRSFCFFGAATPPRGFQLHLKWSISGRMLTVIMECKDQEAALAQTLSTLVSGAVEGLISDVIVLDHGSSDGTARVADSAGCRFLQDWDLRDVIRSARGEWILALQAGSRPQAGWIDEIQEFVAISQMPARFSPSKIWRRPFLERLMTRPEPLERGFLISKRQAIAISRPEMRLDNLPTGLAMKTLRSGLVPAWAMAQKP